MRGTHTIRRGITAATLPLLLIAAGCSSSSETTASGTTVPAYETLEVPGEFPTIQAAVDAAEGGDLVLVSPGVYNEEVIVQTDDIVIRGLDRNEVIVDGQFERDNGIKVFSNGVAVENLTVRNANGNGVFFTGDYESDFVLNGYRASYVTAYNNGDYGIYAFNATRGQFDHSYGSGHPDSAFYIGQCDPCDGLIIDSVGENNQLGYSGTNSSGVTLANNVFRDNMIGIVPNSQDGEKLPPEKNGVFIGNTVIDNNNTEVPINNELYTLAAGIGIISAGGVGNVIERNYVEGQDRAGIAIINWPFRDEGLPPFEAIDNEVRDNVIVDGNPDGLGDMGIWLADPSKDAQGNCFEGNTFTTSFPADIENVLPCDGTRGPAGTPPIDISKLSTLEINVDWKTMAPPPAQENMPDAATAPPQPARPGAVPQMPDLDAITVPKPDDAN